MDDHTRSSIAHYYDTCGLIGEGSFSKVYLLRNANTNKFYACKVISKKDKFNERKVRKEISIMEQLKGCKHLVNIEFSHEDDDNVYIGLEYCSGGTLRSHFEKLTNGYNEDQVKKIVFMALKGLKEMHDKSIMHRDIKLENILFTNSSHKDIKICDFGTATYFPNPKPKELVGTSLYMSPEAIQKRATDKSDAWSLGIITYYLLSNEFPFFEDSVPLIWNSILCQPLDLNIMEVKKISKPAMNFLEVTLNKDENLRPTINELLDHHWFINISSCCVCLK